MAIVIWFVVPLAILFFFGRVAEAMNDGYVFGLGMLATLVYVIGMAFFFGVVNSNTPWEERTFHWERTDIMVAKFPNKILVLDNQNGEILYSTTQIQDFRLVDEIVGVEYAAQEGLGPNDTDKRLMFKSK